MMYDDGSRVGETGVGQGNLPQTLESADSSSQKLESADSSFSISLARYLAVVLSLEPES